MTDEEKTEMFARWHHLLRQSRYAVERAFNQLEINRKRIVIALADIQPSDLSEPYLSGYKLSHYTRSGRDKIAWAVKEIRGISGDFPTMITLKNFHEIDKEIPQ